MTVSFCSIKKKFFNIFEMKEMIKAMCKADLVTESLPESKNKELI